MTTYLQAKSIHREALGLERLDRLEQIVGVAGIPLAIERAAVHRVGALHPTRRGPRNDVEFDAGLDALDVI